jgi:maleylacetoacetate isomerase/maleylpyruvate isomerase
MKLYTYFRSSAAYRVRIALNLKGLAYESVPVHLLRDGGEQKQPDNRARNPLGLVPTLEYESMVLTQSLAIMEWLDETHPECPLLPATADGRAQVRGIAQTIACDIHPLTNLRVLTYLAKTLGVSEEQKTQWYHHWVQEGLKAAELLLVKNASHGRFCFGNSPTLADCCLVPQVFNAKRFNCNLDSMPTIQRIVSACEVLEAFQKASPAQQSDAQKVTHSKAGWNAMQLGNMASTQHFQLDTHTQQNAALVEETSASSESLSAQAVNLTQEIARFRVS